MKPWTISKYKRKCAKYLPRLAAAIWLFDILFIIFVAHAMTARTTAQVVNKPILVVNKVVNTPTPTPTDKEMILQLPYGQLVWQTYVHESGAGQHDSCRASGLYNGFGYGQAKNGSYPCWHSLKDIATLVSGWFEAQLSSKTVPQALCYYNTGDPTIKDCDYAEYTLGL